MSEPALLSGRRGKTKSLDAALPPEYALHSREKWSALTPQTHYSTAAALGSRLGPAPPVHRQVIEVVGTMQDSDDTAETLALTGADVG